MEFVRAVDGGWFSVVVEGIVGQRGDVAVGWIITVCDSAGWRKSKREREREIVGGFFFFLIKKNNYSIFFSKVMFLQPGAVQRQNRPAGDERAVGWGWVANRH